jgi:predicted Fe-Mo cluster-binding NifX family protein
MKIAIASKGNSLKSEIDSNFGRCNYFVIFDTESNSIEFLPNPNKELEEGAGQASVQLIATKSINKIVSGEFGIKIKSILDSLKIQMIVIKDSKKTIQDIISMLNH